MSMIRQLPLMWHDAWHGDSSELSTQIARMFFIVLAMTVGFLAWFIYLLVSIT